MPMSLNQLFPQAERDLLIRELTLDSRGVRPGDLFWRCRAGARMVVRTSPMPWPRARLPWLTRRKAPESCRPAMRR